MSEYDFDLFTLGAGSGGVRGSRVAAQLGARVAVAEERYLGGTCVNVGCVPKKLLAYAGHFKDDFADSEAYGWKPTPPDFDWQTLLQNKDREVARLNGIYEGLLKNAGVRIIEGHAKILDPHTVEVDGERYTTKYILIATGGWPRVPDFPGSDLVITSNEAFRLETLPQRIVIAGGGYIAVEFAGIFSGLGSQVTLIHRGERVLRGFDEDIRAALCDELPKKGIALRLNTTIERVTPNEGGGLRSHCSDHFELDADLVMCAIGRRPKTEDLSSEAVELKYTEQGAVLVNDDYQTSVPNIFAIGDVTSKVQLTPVALAEGMVVAHRLFGEGRVPVGYDKIPTAVFSNPPIGTVGMTEAEARHAHREVDVYFSRFTPMKHTLTGKDTKTMMKMIVDAETDVVLGCHMVGDDAPEIVQGLGIALMCKATKAHFDATIGIHPTAAEEFVTMRTPRG